MTLVWAETCEQARAARADKASVRIFILCKFEFGTTAAQTGRRGRSGFRTVRIAIIRKRAYGVFRATGLWGSSGTKPLKRTCGAPLIGTQTMIFEATISYGSGPRVPRREGRPCG